MEDLKAQYKPELYDKIKDNGYNFAKLIIPELLKMFHIECVLDIGCGGASFLRGCFEQGLDVIGVDGKHVKPSLQIDEAHLYPADLEKSFALGVEFNLCVSLEVAGHIDDKYSDIFIDTLCRHSDNILFSAAQPGQPGIHHVNCQPLEYWKEKFLIKGYDHISIASNWIRSNNKIYHWYRKNSMLFRKLV